MNEKQSSEDHSSTSTCNPAKVGNGSAKNDINLPCKLLSFQTESGRVKRPLNAYLLFSREHRARLQQMNPNLALGQISTILGYMWHKLAQHQKQYYLNMSRQMKALHEQIYPDYKFMRKSKPKKKNMRVLKPRDIRRAAHNVSKGDSREKITQIIKTKSYVPILPKPQCSEKASSVAARNDRERRQKVHNSAISGQTCKEGAVKQELILPSTAFQPTLVVIPSKKDPRQNYSVISDVIAGNRETLARQNPDDFLRSAEELLKCAQISGTVEDDFLLHDSQEDLLLSAEQMLNHAEMLMDDEMSETIGDEKKSNVAEPELISASMKYVDILPKGGKIDINRSTRIDKLLASLEQHRNAVRRKVNKQKTGRLRKKNKTFTPNPIDMDTVNTQDDWLNELAELCAESMRMQSNENSNFHQQTFGKENQIHHDLFSLLKEESSLQDVYIDEHDRTLGNRKITTNSETTDERPVAVTAGDLRENITLNQFRVRETPADKPKTVPDDESQLAMTPKHSGSHEYSLSTLDAPGKTNEPVLLSPMLVSPTSSLDFNFSLNLGESPRHLFEDGISVHLHQTSSGLCTPKLSSSKASLHTGDGEDPGGPELHLSPELDESVKASGRPNYSNLTNEDLLYHGVVDCFLPLPDDSGDDSFTLQATCSVALTGTSDSTSPFSVPSFNVSSTISNAKNTLHSGVNIQTKQNKEGQVEQDVGFVLSIPEKETVADTPSIATADLNPFCASSSPFGVNSLAGHSTAENTQAPVVGNTEAQSENQGPALLPSVSTLTTMAKLNFGCSATKLHSFRGEYSIAM